MLQYVWNNENYNYLEDGSFNRAENVDILESDRFLWIGLLRNLEKLERYGLKRTYREINEIGSNIKGKIDFQKSIKLNLIKSLKLNYSYDIFDEDNNMNRIIKGTLLKLKNEQILNQKKDSDLKKKLLYFEKFFLNVKSINLNNNLFVKTNYLRENTYGYLYKNIILLCHFLFIGSLPDHVEIGRRMFNKLLEMIDTTFGIFFERFIRGFYGMHKNELDESHHSKIEVNQRKLKWLFKGQNNNFLPGLETDIVIKSVDSKKTIVIECKYVEDGPLNNNEKFISDHMQQLFSYMVNIKENKCTICKDECHCRREKIIGVLLYGERDKERNKEYEEKYNGEEKYTGEISKGEFIDLWIITIDLLMEPSMIHERLISIMNKIMRESK